MCDQVFIGDQRSEPLATYAGVIGMVCAPMSGAL